MGNWNRQSIINFIEQNSATLQNMGVQRIGLFGSFVRDEQGATSDIDLLISLNDFSFANWMDVWNYFEDSFQCNVDIVPEQDLREEIRDNILAEVEYVTLTNQQH